ncbi:MAG TPA: hypothetical protein VN704_10145 [Verrucomicrobiae bacterium]|nr:hypothetical protein [Verrucomicrobiae bacterium]
MASAQICLVNIVHNIISSTGVNGMIFHIMFSVQGLMDRTGNLSTYFNYLQDPPLMGFDLRYRSNNGRVCVGSFFAPRFEIETFPDVQLFMPYASLDLVPSAIYNLMCQVIILDMSPSPNVLAASEWHPFTVVV